jgi:type II secretion system protein G
MKNLRGGFTLIELLVVIAIISILAAVLYASFDEARETARNRAIQAEMKELQLAIELYRSQYGRYPAESNGLPTGHQTGINFVPDYIAELPQDNDSGNPACDFEYFSDGSTYKFTAERCLGGAADASEGVQPGDDLARCPASCGTTGHCDPTSVDFYESYAVYSAGAECRE